MLYDAEELVKAEDANGDSLWFDPDAWSGEGHDDLHSVEVPYEDFSVYFNQYTICEAEMLDQQFCDVAIGAEQSQFKPGENLFFEAAPILHPFLTDDIVDLEASRKVFDDVRSYLEKPI